MNTKKIILCALLLILVTVLPVSAVKGLQYAKPSIEKVVTVEVDLGKTKTFEGEIETHASGKPTLAVNHLNFIFVLKGSPGITYKGTIKVRAVWDALLEIWEPYKDSHGGGHVIVEGGFDLKNQKTWDRRDSGKGSHQKKPMKGTKSLELEFEVLGGSKDYRFGVIAVAGGEGLKGGKYDARTKIRVNGTVKSEAITGFKDTSEEDTQTKPGADQKLDLHENETNYDKILQDIEKKKNKLKEKEAEWLKLQIDNLWLVFLLKELGVKIDLSNKTFDEILKELVKLIEASEKSVNDLKECKRLEEQFVQNLVNSNITLEDEDKEKLETAREEYEKAKKKLDYLKKIKENLLKIYEVEEEIKALKIKIAKEEKEYEECRKCTECERREDISARAITEYNLLTIPQEGWEEHKEDLLKAAWFIDLIQKIPGARLLFKAHAKDIAQHWAEWVDNSVHYTIVGEFTTTQKCTLRIWHCVGFPGKWVLEEEKYYEIKTGPVKRELWNGWGNNLKYGEHGEPQRLINQVINNIINTLEGDYEQQKERCEKGKPQ